MSSKSMHWFVIAVLFFTTRVLAQHHVRSELPSAKKGKELFERKWEPRTGTTFTREVFPDEEEETVYTDGLGPHFNAASCADCHPKGGSSDVQRNIVLISIDPYSRLISESTEANAQDVLHLFPGLLGTKGTLLFETSVHDQSTQPDYAELRSRLLDYIEGEVPDNWFDPGTRTQAAVALKPVLEGNFGSIRFYLSQRNTPSLHGISLINGVSVERIRAEIMRQNRLSDGEISGRFAGRFGWRGQVTDSLTFVSQACSGELGLAVPSPERVSLGSRAFNRASRRAALRNPARLKTEEPLIREDITSKELLHLNSFVASLARPQDSLNAAKGESLMVSLRGEALFDQVGCSACHVPDLGNAKGIFSDLSLHDMGEALKAPTPAAASAFSSSFASFQGDTSFALRKFKATGTAPENEPSLVSYYQAATGFPSPMHDLSKSTRGVMEIRRDDIKPGSWEELQREWRTPPLWAVADSAPYLHDGRAATLEEAILLHGGEAESSRNRFDQLERDKKDLMIRFLSSLKAPSKSAL